MEDDHYEFNIVGAFYLNKPLDEETRTIIEELDEKDDANYWVYNIEEQCIECDGGVWLGNPTICIRMINNIIEILSEREYILDGEVEWTGKNNDEMPSIDQMGKLIIAGNKVRKQSATLIWIDD